MATQSLSPEMTNFARVFLAISDVCTESLRVVLLHNIPGQDIKQRVNALFRIPYHRMMFKKFILPNDQLDPNFSVSDCNFSLLYFLIRRVSSVEPPLLGWGNSCLNNPQDTSIGVSVERLRELRDTVVHLHEPRLSNQEFHSCWNKLRDCLTVIDTYLGGTTYQEKLDRLKTDDMYTVNGNRLLESVLCKLQDLQAGQHEHSQTLSRIREEQYQGFHDNKTGLDRTFEKLSEVKSLIKDQNQQLPQIATGLTEMKSTLDNLKEMCEQMKGKGSLENLRVLHEVEVSQEKNLKAAIDETETVFIHKMIAELAKSVGIIKTPDGSGTGFRVGPNYIMTARHVVESIMGKGSQQDMFIHFSYERLPCDPDLRFYFEPEIVYESVHLDTVILKLMPDIKAYPPPLTIFNDVTWDKSHGYFIGHSLADIKKTDKYHVVKLEESDIDRAKKWSIDFINMDGYNGIENQHCVLFQCSFEKGASGSPGFWINPGDGQAYLELMLLCGYPTWYYDKFQYKGNTCGILNNFFVEQGVSMRSVYDDLKEKDQLLCNTIFGPRTR